MKTSELFSAAQFNGPGLDIQANPGSNCETSAPGRRVAAVYLHIPYCFHKCHYCDFYSIATPSSRETASERATFTEAVIAEIEAAANREPLLPKTVFVGGGTPTLLEADLWRQLLDALRGRGLLDAVTEFTVEANPETVTPELLALLRAGGVNRISIGAQSFDEAHLKTLERWHDPANVSRAVTITRDAGIDNINLDLIFAIPGQTIDDVARDLDAALALEPSHVSYYSLIYEPNTAMTQRLKMGEFDPVDEETERQMYALVMRTLDEAGYGQYEISNWARRDDVGANRCEHNLIYWQNENWLGFGPSAASHFDGWRWKNEAHLGRYLAGAGDPPITDVEQLEPDRQIGEQLMLKLRLNEGVDQKWLGEQLDADDPRRAEIDDLIERGFLERTTTHLRLTGEGRFVANAVIARLL